MIFSFPDAGMICQVLMHIALWGHHTIPVANRTIISKPWPVKYPTGLVAVFVNHKIWWLILGTRK